MDYITQYYKNLSEQLQQRVDNLKNKIKYLKEDINPLTPPRGSGYAPPLMPSGYGSGGFGGNRTLPPIQPTWGAPYGGFGGFGGAQPPSRPTGPGGAQSGNGFPEGYENNPLYLEWLAENPKPNPIYYPQQYQQWLAAFWTWYYQTFN